MACRTKTEKEKEIGILVEYIKQIEAFSTISESILLDCVYKLRPVVFTKGQAIFSKGAKVQEALLIYEGQVLKTKESKSLLHDPTSQVLGERDLVGFEILNQETKSVAEWNYFCVS